ncbi:NAD(P)H-binding protein [Actinomadura citrea]|uniref:NAD(P)H-binding protein n=1 Tax=Actinomadura citrea TaxID=46158 RepID=UPI002E28A989|nr:NAD(P)H-binding protein [Actinomadura citrea]
MLLLTGATGNIGGDLARELAGRGARFRVLVRDPARAAGLPAAERVVADLGDAATLPPAFAGADRLFLLPTGIGLEHTANAVAAARDAGVRHIVHLSSLTVVGDPVPAMGRWHHEREEVVRASGIPFTILRAGAFMANALEWAATVRGGGYVLDPTGPGRFAPVDTADLAAVAAAVLTEDGHQGRTYALTGGELLTVAEQVEMIAAAAGRGIEARPARTPEEAVRARFPGGAPPALADGLVDWYARMRAGGAAIRTDTVERLLGRPPRTFAAWCERNADAFSGT